MTILLLRENPETLTAADRAAIAALAPDMQTRRHRRPGADRGGAGGGRDRSRPHIAGPARPDAQPALVPAVGRGRRLADAPPRDRGARLRHHQRVRRPRDPDQRAHPGAAARLRPPPAAGDARPTTRRMATRGAGGHLRAGRQNDAADRRWRDRRADGTAGRGAGRARDRRAPRSDRARAGHRADDRPGAAGRGAASRPTSSC